MDTEVLSYIRDEMLANPSEDAHFIYMCTHLAESDKELYALLSEWMSDVYNREDIEQEIHARVAWLTEYDDMFG